MKKLFPAALALALVLAACKGPAAETTPTPAPTPEVPTQFRFSRDNFPQLDGSTATVPLGEAMAAVLLGESREEARGLISFNKTSRAYYNLVDGNADLLIVAEGGEDSYQYRDDHGKKWRMEPIAAETLVFFVNEDNPVNGLTLDEVRDIYSGKITNWKEVGGSDSPIQAYQRPKGGGSQAIMDKEVMKDLPMMEPANSDYVVGSMIGIIEAVRSWDDRPDAMGYTVYYYAHDMGMADGLKLLAIDGVMPNEDTIRSGEYPIRTYYYAVMDESTPADSPTARLFDWLLSQEGQNLVSHEGYVSILEPTGEISQGPVYTDWSKLDPYALRSPHYTRRYEDFTDRLVPAADYGPLIPFAGAELAGTGEWSYYEGQYDTFSLYGLVTMTGEVVTDPVFTSAFHLEERDSWGNVIYDPGVMLLGKTFYDGEGHPEERFALCKGDGSWCTDFVYQYDWETYMSMPFDRGIPLLRTDGKLDLVDPVTGKANVTLDLPGQAGTEEFSLTYLEVDPDSGRVSVNLYIWNENSGGNLALLFDPAGNCIPIPQEVKWLGRAGEGLVPAGGPLDGQGNAYRYGYLDAASGQWVIEPTLWDANPFENGVAPVYDGMNYYFIDPTGKALTGGYDKMPTYWGEEWYFLSNSYQPVCIMDKDLNILPDSPLLASPSVGYLNNGWVYGKNDTEWLLVRGEEVWRFPLSLGQLTDLCGQRVLFHDEEGGIVTLTNLEGDILGQWGDYSSAYFSYDGITGECVINAYHYDDNTYWTDYYGLNGELLLHAQGYDTLMGNLCYHAGEGLTTLTDRAGKAVFRWVYDPVVD